MADILTSNLYPPIIDSFMPAFTIDEGDPESVCIVKFTIPDTISLDQINTNAVQVIIKNQKSNINSIKYNKTKSPAGILLKEMYEEDSENGIWYITIKPNEMKDDRFYYDELYKLQLRFTSSEIEVDENTIPNAVWISDNLEKFSEWSTVCLLKRISQPTITEKSFIRNSIAEPLYCNSAFLNLNETIRFPYAHENEYLSYYKVELYSISESEEEQLVEESNIIYNSEDTLINKIKYKFKYLLATGIRVNENTGEIEESLSTLEHDYKVKIFITTNNLYTKTFEIPFIASAVEGITPDVTFTTAPDPDQGRIKISFQFNNTPTIERTQFLTGGETETITIPINHAVIHRNSNKNKFIVVDGEVIPEWEEIARIKLTNNDFNNHKIISFYDNSIEAGTFYQYGLRVVNANETYSSILITEDDYHICDFEDVFINSNNRQLKMRYDSRVTSYKRVVMENKVETIGSRFPFIRRNTTTNYKQFAINGLITFHTDDANIFLSEQDIYGGRAGMDIKYKNYNLENNITPYIDYTKEREFREKVIDFLNSGKPMLLRTMTEGNILVRLMDINITPNQSLNNYICSFTANALEIAEANFENYDKYKIFDRSNIQVTRETPND